MNVNVLHTVIDGQSSLLSPVAALTHLPVPLHVHKAGCSQTHHRHVTPLFPVHFTQLLYYLLYCMVVKFGLPL